MRVKKRLQFNYDESKDLLEVEGLKFSGEFFRVFSLPDENSVYSIRRDDNNTVTITREGKLRQPCKHRTVFTYKASSWCKDCDEHIGDTK